MMSRFIALIESDRSYFLRQPFSSTVVLVLTLCTFLFGIAYSIVLGNMLRFPDEAVYVKLVNNLLFKNFYSFDGVLPTATRPPGYSFMMYPIFLLGGDIVHVRIVQFFFLALSIFLIHKLLYAWSYRLASCIAGLLAFCYPVLFYTAGTLYPQTATALLFLLVCYLIGRPQASLAHWVFGGVAFGYLVLTTPTFLALVPLLLIWPWAQHFRRAFITNAVLLMMLMAVTAPWMIRNYVVFERFVPFSTNSGLNLLIGNSENAQPNAGTTTDISKYKEAAKVENLSELEADNFYKAAAFEWIVHNPAEAVKLYILKFLTHFHFSNELRTRTESSVWRDAIMFITYYPLLVLAVLRLVTGGSLKSRPFEVFATASYLMIGATYAIFFTRIRFRLPVDWMMIAMASIYVGSLLESRKRRGVLDPTAKT